MYKERCLYFAFSSVTGTVGIQLAYSWHTVGIQLAYSWHTVGTNMAINLTMKVSIKSKKNHIDNTYRYVCGDSFPNVCICPLF